MKHHNLKPVSWFNQTFNTKDSMQALVVLAFIALLIITKCYMLLA